MVSVLLVVASAFAIVAVFGGVVSGSVKSLG